MITSRPVQTSLTHPLTVDVVPAAYMGSLKGRIGMTIAPGKKDLQGFTGAHDRDLTSDLDTLYAQFTPDAFVSLMEAWEYNRFQIGALFHAVRGRGTEIIHYPIVDVSVPGNGASFRVLVERLYNKLVAGESLVVHCKGGLGRTGLVVACLLVRMGHSPEEAIRITRQTRAGTIQTRAQEAWVYSYGAAR